MSAELVRHTPIVLYLSITGGGAAHSLLNMILSVKGKVKPIVVFPDRNGIYQKFIEHGIMCLVVPFEQEVFYKNFFQSLPIWRKPVYIAGKMRHFLLRNIIFNSRVKKALKGERIDIVHTNTGTISIGVSLAEALGAKHVWHLREFQDKDFGAKPFWGWSRYYRMLHKSDAIIAITNAIARHFKIFKINKNAFVIWNAVAEENQTSIIQDKENCILFVAANVSQAKGLDDLIRAFGESELFVKGFRLKVVGEFSDNQYKQSISQHIASLGISEYVDFLGYREDCVGMMQMAKVLVMPSHSEALGRVAIEAMFNGCPVIARDAGGPSEYIVHSKNGLLFKTKEELVQALLFVCNDDVSNMIANAQEFVVKNFSEESYAVRLMDVYNKLFI